MSFAALGAALSATSCVSLVTPEAAAIRVDSRSASPLGIGVVDKRAQVGGGASKDRYMGRCRLGLYGIPTPVIDPKMSFSERIRQQLEAGFEAKGVSVVPAAGAARSLVIRIEDDTWIDFANPLTGNASILYFHATAEVVSGGRTTARASRRLQKDFRYDANDSLFNQAVWTFQPEFSALVNDPKIRAALAR